MTTSTFQSVNLLPAYFQTEKNSKFLSSTLDQLIRPAELERVNGYVGTRVTPTHNSTSDFYISESRPYQLAPAMVIKSSEGEIQDVVSYDDLYNEIDTHGGITTNLDRLFRSEFYSYTPHIDWDKLINYQEYFWLITGPDPILITDDNLDVDQDIVGKSSYSYTVNSKTITLSNGMLIKFYGSKISSRYRTNMFFVEGVGTSIKLVDYSLLSTPGPIATIYNENFDADLFDSYPFDGDKTLPVVPEYVTINRASRDLNPWSRYNRWVHKDVITATAYANGISEPVYPASNRARRPIIEFSANLKLYNFGNNAVKNVDYIDNVTTDAFSLVEGSGGFYVDVDTLRPVPLQHGHRVIFNADTDPMVRGKIYEVRFNILNGKYKLSLVPTDDHTPELNASVSVISGKNYGGTSWWFNGTKWIYSQQHTKINQAPLFELFDDQGTSYTEYISNFSGNKIFSYSVGSGKPDKILGFPLNFKQPNQGIGSYLFENNLTSEVISITQGQTIGLVPTSDTYCKFSNSDGDVYANAWTKALPYRIPILQFQATTETTSVIEVTSVNNLIDIEFNLEVYVNFKKTTDYTLVTDGRNLFVNFLTPLDPNTNVLFKTYSFSTPTPTGYYELPLGLTNNPLNGPISSMTLTDLQEHVKTMIEGTPSFVGSFPGNGNIRDLSDIGPAGTRLISSANPISFAQMFIGKKEHSVIDAITKASNHYNQFKLGFIKQLAASSNQSDAVSLVDQTLLVMNVDKNTLDSYYLSDMVPYGTNVDIRSWTVTDSRNKIYPLKESYNPNTLGFTSVLVYLNGVQLLLDIDYKFDVEDSNVEILTDLVSDDVLKIKYFSDTIGSYVPPTPSKLGMYPKFEPKIYTDTTYVTPIRVIQGHDGSITVAYNDYRDDAILEFEKRVYNNIKVSYRPDLFDVTALLPGAFRQNLYSLTEANSILRQDFVNWSGHYGIDQTANSSFDEEKPFTWNYTGSFNSLLTASMSGSWRSVYKYFYDTDRPHTHPWEMLGFSEEPSWWVDQYGSLPYTSGNEVMWSDIEAGVIAQGDRAGINVNYARPNLTKILPVDEYGNLNDPTVNLLTDFTPYNIRQPWQFGDQGPAETAWRKSSFWPFAVQKALALMYPSNYASLMYDVSRMDKNIANQWSYGPTHSFLDLQAVVIPKDNLTLTSGYSVYVTEIGRSRNQNYVEQLTADIQNLSINLFHKVGGFVNKDSLTVVVDAIDPISTGPGALLSSDDYSLILNVSNPIKTARVSGLIIQRDKGSFVLRGYDLSNPYFNIYSSIRNSNTPTINVGGVSSQYINWSPATTGGASNLNSIDTTTAKAASASLFYQKGQYVKYGNEFYVVTFAHQSGNKFEPTYFQKIDELPITGGATVQLAKTFDKNRDIQIPYGTSVSSIQEIYDIIIGYGEWLKDQGFVFDDYNTNFNETINWDFTAKEFLYWSTQQWSDNSIITLSPFANKLQYGHPQSVVSDIFDSYYDYKILNSSGSSIPKYRLSVSRDNGICTISSKETDLEGIYFAVLRSVQKEHGMIFNNSSIFGDTIYDVETGFFQQRVLLNGFRTANWNGDYFNPGFIYDTAQISKWTQYKNYRAGSIVYYSGNYYSSSKNLTGTKVFNFNDWTILPGKPESGLLPNFDYKISQFNDFYNLDIDNFDAGQQKAAQHLTGYTPRPYLNNIIKDPIAQYKFYQGFIKEKGTKNAITKLSKATIHNHQGNFTYNEEWAFRIGKYGSYTTYQELEVPLIEGSFVDNPQIVVFTDELLPNTPNNLKYYSTASNWQIVPENYVSSTTFSVSSGTFLDNDHILATAGYVRLDDVSYTSVNRTTLANFARNTTALNEGDTIWLGFVPFMGWDVVRYTLSPAEISSIYISDPDVSITVITDASHNISVGELVSITNYDSDIDGVYTVIDVPSVNSFTIPSTVGFIRESSTGGVIHKFGSVRFNTFDDMPDNKELLGLPGGTKVWIDNDNGSWAVYEKINNYEVTTENSIGDLANQQLGWSISKRHGSNVLVAGSPGYALDGQYGRVSFYIVEPDASLTRKLFYNLDAIQDTAIKHTIDGSPSSEFGYTVVYDDFNFNNSGYGLIFASAPAAQTTATFAQSGLVKISNVNYALTDEFEKLTINHPDPSSYSRFGSSIFVQRNTNTSKLLLISAPGTISTGTGAVYVYTVDANTSTVTAYWANTILSPNPILGGLWGNSISGSDDASVIAIGQVGNSGSQGFVKLYSYDGALLMDGQSIPSPCLPNSKFGQKVLVSPDGQYLFVGAPTNVNYDQTLGAVIVYKNNNGTFEYDQVITNPVNNIGLQFGVDFDIGPNNDTLIISSLGDGVLVDVTFDTDTSFDGKSTMFFDTLDNSGTAYIYNKHVNRFVVAQELSPVSLVAGTDYGKSVAIDTNNVFVGAPAFDNNSIKSSIFYFNKLDTSVNGWTKIRSQNDLISIDKVKRVMLVNTSTEEVIDYLDVIDPLKGRISGIADQEITYKLAVDPAIYSVGLDTSSVDLSSNWADSHIGELWWDLSASKYQWYEQGDDTFRKNHWGKLFPGTTINVYEWVKTSLLPSQWSVIADTPSGLTMGYSGQPLYPNDTVYSVKQEYNSSTGNFDKYTYYYWVKNKVTVPKVKNRRTSAYDVASLIQDPNGYGLQYASIISPNSVILSNIAGLLEDSNVNLNISIDENTEIPKHTEWLLLQEGLPTSVPNKLLEKKLFDSLIGHDNLGNLVPDPSLTPRLKYGIEIRPRQSMFKNRLAALRNLVGYANSVLADNIINGKYNFANLNSKEEIPLLELNQYDQIVEDEDQLLSISTVRLGLATMECTVGNGKIRSVTVTNPGLGYLRPPTVHIVSSQGTDAVITTTIDEFGRVVSAEIAHAGSGYITAPSLEVRPYSVIVLSDPLTPGKWSKFEYDSKIKEWVRRNTQKFNTPLYWSYVDWSSEDYNQFLDYTVTVNYVYETEGLLLTPGNYVKVKDNGLGNYIILKSVTANGTFSEFYDIVFAQNGTIKLSDTIWTKVSNPNSYDEISNYDQILYDQTPDIELEKILTALRDNIFINELKVHWNLFFFKAVKYAHTEQKLLDWAFKTSFISITNLAGELGQPPVYKLTSSTNFEQYIKEVKPYKTQLRTFTENYNLLDNSETGVTDIDRSMDISIKFDRFMPETLTDDFNVVDNFICDGTASEYKLSWLAYPDKKLITVTLDGLRVLWANYTIKYYTETYNGYSKKFCKIVFLNSVPAPQKILQISYVKSSELLTATERISKYYAPSSGNPGLSFGQLMSGIDYPYTRIDTLPFNYSTDWDNTTFSETTWGNNISYYSTAKSISTASTGSNVISMSTTSGIVAGQRVNVISTISNVFNSVEVTVTAINTSARTVSVSSTLTNTLRAGAQFEFWSVDSNVSILDTAIDGGDLGYTVARGTNPTDVIIDGKGFYTAESGHAPEELVPGKVSESLGLNVYTKTPAGAPTIYSGIMHVDGGQVMRFPFPINDVDPNSIVVTSGTQKYGIGYANPALMQPGTFTILVPENVIQLKSSTTGTVSYYVLDIGGGSGQDAGVIDHKSIFTIEDSAQLVSLAGATSAKSAYVEVMGIPISALTTSTDTQNETYYVLEPFNQDINRASVVVYNLSKTFTPLFGLYVSAWFFASKHPYFNVVSSQIIPATTATYSYTLNPVPGTIGPLASQVLLEQYSSNGNRTLLVPPEASYYKVSGNTLTFDINARLPDRAPPGSYRIDNNTVAVYVNGIKIKPGFDFTVDEANNTVTLTSLVARKNDVIAVVDLFTGYDFNIDGDQLILSNGVALNGSFLMTTFTDHDGMLIQTSTFSGTPSGRFKLGRTVSNTNYVWVWLNNMPLKPSVDYSILSDGLTLQISDDIIIKTTDSIFVRSIASDNLSSTTLAYRIFNDMFNRTNFKRISLENSTYLTQPLTYNDTEIHIKDAGAIIPPNPFSKIPGVIIIAGERIEFFQKDGTVLSQLRRGTLGTSPKTYVEALTQVIDQSPDQTIPYNETILKQLHYTTSTTATYVISTTALTTNLPYSTSTVVSDGITLSSNVSAADQIEVYYGGRLLSKSGMYYQDPKLGYDSPEFIMLGSIASEDLLPKTLTLNSAYLVTSTNQVWVYTNSLSDTAVNGYEYKGLRYMPPEFSINIDIPTVLVSADVTGNAPPTGSGWVLPETTATMQIQPGWIMQDATGARYTVIYSGHNTLFNGWGVGFVSSLNIAWPLTFIGPALQQITLNTLHGIGDNIKLVMVKKQVTSTTLWNNGVSLLDSTTAPAVFLQSKPARLPDVYYYGDTTLTTDGGFALTDSDDAPLEGF
jgi:hypothetical protein